MVSTPLPVAAPLASPATPIQQAWAHQQPLSSATLHQLIQTGRLSGANLRGANLAGLDLRTADLGGADLSGADLSGANLSGANLRNADLTRANLRHALLRHACLNGAGLSEACLEDCNGDEAEFLGSVAYGTNFEGASLRGAVFTQAYALEANFARTQLQRADFRWANLSRACFAQSQQQQTRFGRAITRGIPLAQLSPGTATPGEAGSAIAPQSRPDLAPNLTPGREAQTKDMSAKTTAPAAVGAVAPAAIANPVQPQLVAV